LCTSRTVITSRQTRAQQSVAGVYALTPELADTEELLRRVAAALLGGVRIVQYRDKSNVDAVRLRQASALRAACASAGATFIINDDIELASAVGADGVHLGRDDVAVAVARARLGGGALIGASCYDSLARAEGALAAGADYIAFGSFFASRIKPDAVRAHVSLISEAKSRCTVPVVAIGGITASNAAPLVAAGVDALAVVTALFDTPDIVAAAQGLEALFAVARRS
jgi:thiamine-phosphate pyrophosphorylase